MPLGHFMHSKGYLSHSKKGLQCLRSVSDALIITDLLQSYCGRHLARVEPDPVVVKGEIRIISFSGATSTDDFASVGICGTEDVEYGLSGAVASNDQITLSVGLARVFDSPEVDGCQISDVHIWSGAGYFGDSVLRAGFVFAHESLIHRLNGQGKIER